MKTPCTQTRYLQIALGLAGLAVAGHTSALAQSASKFGSPLPSHYESTGALVPGWTVEPTSTLKVAHAPSVDKNGYGAFAQAPAIIHHVVTKKRIIGRH
jgi:hypothetical protein